MSILETLISMGKSVIIVGRTESKLKSTASEIGATAYYTLDTGDVKSIPSFVEKVTKDHPELDCLINNAGVQRPFQALGPDYEFDLGKADQEIDINIRGPMHLSLGFLPHFNAQPNGGVIMNVSSVLGFVPYSVINPNYNGTKAWVHMFSMNLRTQLAQAGSKVRVVEIVPPSVETDLHRERKDPDDNKRAKGAKMSLTIQEFMDDVLDGWKADTDTVSAGPGKALVKKWYEAYGESYSKATGGK
jgi:short-subunit dehydrogenase involved in D-alanine esterification of teichoic acids